MLITVFPNKWQTASQSAPPPFLGDLGEPGGQRSHSCRRSCLVFRHPPPSRARAQRRAEVPARKSLLPTLQAQSPSPVTSPPTQRPRAFLGLRGIVSFPPSIQPSQPARYFQPEGRGTLGWDSFGGSPGPWGGKGCLLVPPCPMGAECGGGGE